MSKISAKSLTVKGFTAKSFTVKNLTARSLTAILSIVTVGAAISFGLVGTATAGDNNVTEDQIVRALAPPPKGSSGAGPATQ